MTKIINAEAFEAYAVKALKLTAEEVDSLYNESGELTDFSTLETKDAARIKKLSTDKDNQYKRGLKEGAEKLENELKEKYEVDSELIGVELFDHIVEVKLADVSAKGETDIMANPEVIKLVNKHSKELKEKDKELADKLRAKEDEINLANLFKEVETNALTEFDSLNPILPSDPKKSQALKAILVNELKKNKYQKDGENYVVLKEDGTPLQDEHGYAVPFKEHVKGYAERYFDFKAAEDRTSAGNKSGTGHSNGAVRKPKDEAEYQSMMKDSKYTSAQKIEIKDLHTKN